MKRRHLSCCNGNSHSMVDLRTPWVCAFFHMLNRTACSNLFLQNFGQWSKAWHFLHRYIDVCGLNLQNLRPNLTKFYGDAILMHDSFNVNSWQNQNPVFGVWFFSGLLCCEYCNLVVVGLEAIQNFILDVGSVELWCNTK